jgi:hypothetical protein
MTDLTRLRRLTDDAVAMLRALADEARPKGIYVAPSIECMAAELGPMVRAEIRDMELDA